MTQIVTPEDLRASYERIWTRTEMRESPDYYARCLDLAEPRPGERLLDVACGGGFLLMEAERRGLATSGIDIAEAALVKARAIAPKSDLRRGDAEALPYADASFDIVTCLGSAEHFLRPQVAFEEMRRVLAPGGRAIIVVPNQWFAYDVARGWVEGVGLTHGQESENYFSIGEARALIGEAFWIGHVEGWNPPARLANEMRPFRGRWRRVALRAYGWLRPRLPLAAAYVFVFVGTHAPADAPADVRPGTVESPMLVGAWHDSEGDFARWTARRAGAWLRLGASVRALVRHSEPDGAPLAVTVGVDRGVAGTGTVPTGEWTELAFDVPEAMRGTVQRVFLESERTWSPAERGDPNDNRELGVSVQRIWSA